MVVATTLAFFTRSYRKLTKLYEHAPAQPAGGEGPPESSPDAPPPVRGIAPEIPDARE